MDQTKEPETWSVAIDRFLQSDGELLESGMLSDAEIKCDQSTWKVHKVILCTRSDWFKKALMGPFEARNPFQEGQTGKVTIREFKPADVDCLLKFVYTGVINPRNSYPSETTWCALIKIWRMADFFCLDMLRDLVIGAAKDCSLKMAQVFCAFDALPGHDQREISLFDTEFAPVVKAIYEDEQDSIKCHFAPIILGLAIASVHKFSQMESFEKLLQDVSPFAADWATALMKGLPQPTWYSGWNPGQLDMCGVCNQALRGSGVVDTFAFISGSQSPRALCAQCYRGPDLEIWEDQLQLRSQGW